jgi:hypothetical protein
MKQMHASIRSSTPEPGLEYKEDSLQKARLNAYLARLEKKQRHLQAHPVDFDMSNTTYKAPDIDAAQIEALRTSNQNKINTLKSIIAKETISLASRELLKKGQEIRIQKLIDTTAILAIERPKYVAHSEIAFAKPSPTRPSVKALDLTESPIASREGPLVKYTAMPEASPIAFIAPPTADSKDSPSPFYTLGSGFKKTAPVIIKQPFSPD